LLNGTLSADRLRITGGGEVVRFEGNVVMNLDNLGAEEVAAPETAAPAANQSANQSAKTRSVSGKSANTK
jgi:lipopolysaccharide export system protein LptC